MKRIVLILLALCLCGSVVFAEEEQHWFFTPSQDLQPKMPPDGLIDPGEGALYVGPNEKRIYLTFDAGYANENVYAITEILKEEEVPAAFFILKQVILENPDLIEAWREAGFLVCNHTYSHKNCARLSDEELKSELTKLADLYREKTGYELAPFFRPPEGSYTTRTVAAALECGYRTVFWSAAYADWDNQNQPAPTKSLNLMLSRTHNGAIVLLHPTSKTNAAILKDYIRTLKTAGYTFGSLEEL